MFSVPKVIQNSQKDLQENINAIIKNGYVEYFQQNAQKLRDGMDSTLLHKTDCLLGNHFPHLRDTLTERQPEYVHETIRWYEKSIIFGGTLREK